MKTAGQVAFETWLAQTGSFSVPWEGLLESSREKWERIAVGQEPGPDGWKPAPCPHCCKFCGKSVKAGDALH